MVNNIETSNNQEKPKLLIKDVHFFSANISGLNLTANIKIEIHPPHGGVNASASATL
jgi:hypothetical protein